MPGPPNDASHLDPPISAESLNRALQYTLWLAMGFESWFPDAPNNAHAANASTGFINGAGSSGQMLPYPSPDDILGTYYYNNAHVYGTPVEEEPLLPMGQLRPLADGAEAAVHAAENYTQYQPPQHMVDGSEPYTDPTFIPTQAPYDPSQNVPQYWPGFDQSIPNESPQTPLIDYHHAPSTSTPSYHPDQYAGSSQYDTSQQTDPSSISGSMEQTYFSPSASPHYSRALDSFHAFDCLVPRVRRPDYLALPSPLPADFQAMGASMGLQTGPSSLQQAFSNDQQSDVAGAGLWDAESL